MKDIDLNIIEVDQIAIDILAGNSSLDMLNRAFGNPKLQEVFKAVDNDSSLLHIVELNFYKLLNSNLKSDYKSQGKIIAYLSVFAKSKSPKSYRILSEFSNLIQGNSYLKELVNFCIDYSKNHASTNFNLAFDENDEWVNKYDYNRQIFRRIEVPGEIDESEETELGLFTYASTESEEEEIIAQV